jgi:Ca2+-transporting ATPase
VYYWKYPGDWRTLLSPIWLSYRELLLTDSGRTYILATTVFLVGVVASQIGNAFACRTGKERVRRLGFFSNRMLLIGVGAELGLILALVYIPVLNDLFELVPVPHSFWAFLAFYGPILYILEKLRKSLFRRGFLKRGDEPTPKTENASSTMT